MNADFDNAEIKNGAGGGCGTRVDNDSMLRLWKGDKDVFAMPLKSIVTMRDLLGECADMLSRCAGDAEEAGYDQRAENIHNIVERAMIAMENTPTAGEVKR